MYRILAKCGAPQFKSDSVPGVIVKSIELDSDWDARISIDTNTLE